MPDKRSEPLTMRDAQANYFVDAFDVDRIRRNDPRPFPPLPVLDVDPVTPPECVPFASISGGLELARFADAGGVPSRFDLRRDSGDRLLYLNRTLLELGGARRAPRR